MKKVLKTLTRICSGLLGLLLLVMIFAVFLPLTPPFRGYFHTRTVLTGSMSPVIPTGSLIVSRYYKDRDLAVGDIVTFQSPNSLTPPFITHRITSVDKSDQLYRFQTKGDANLIPEAEKISQANIEGKVIAVFPYLGYLVDLLKTPIVFAVVFFLPLSIFIVRQLRDAFKIWVQISNKKNEEKNKILDQKLSIFVTLFLLLQITLPTRVYASFHSSQVQIKTIKLSTALEFGCKGKDKDKEKTDKNDDDKNKNDNNEKHDDKNGRPKDCDDKSDEDREHDHDHDDNEEHHPQAEFTRSSDKKFMSFKIHGLSQFRHLSYEFTYDSDGTDFGVIGKDDLSGEDIFSRDIQLGNCSREDCVYHPDPKNFRLYVKLDDQNNEKTEVNIHED